MATDRSMGLFEHIKELRARLFRAVIAWLLATLLASMAVEPIVAWLVRPIGGASVIVLSPTEAPIIYFKIAIAAGFGLSLPYMLYQVYAFISPGLYPNEKSILLMAIPAVLVFFIAGALFTLQVMLPISIPVLMGFLGDVVQPTYSLDRYLRFVTTIVTWMGLLFQTPLIMYMLSRFGLVQPEQMAKARRVAWFVAVVFAAVITETTDPVTHLLVTGPFVALYEIGILMARVGKRQRRRNRPEEAETA